MEGDCAVGCARRAGGAETCQGDAIDDDGMAGLPDVEHTLNVFRRRRRRRRRAYKSIGYFPLIHAAWPIG